MPRLLQCVTCRTLEKLPDYEGLPENDVMLDALVTKHEGHHGNLFKIDQATYDNLEQRTQIEKEIWQGQAEFAATRDTFEEDALACFNKHGRPKMGCIDYCDDRKRIGSPTKKKNPRLKPVYLCYFCLSADTEVVTRYGIQRISDVVGTPELVVPVANRWGDITTRGAFRRVEVRSFGVQPLMRIVLKKGRAMREVFATAEHRWMLSNGAVEPTRLLEPGDDLKSLTLTSARIGAASRATRKMRDWRVVSVEKTDRVEEVFCAVVPGVEAFALADDLMTMNCPVHSGFVSTEIRHKGGLYR